jgi:hypothetical protein
VGTFADPSGAIVGTPFFVGTGPVSFAGPAGATQSQLAGSAFAGLCSDASPC